MLERFFRPTRRRTLPSRRCSGAALAPLVLVCALIAASEASAQEAARRPGAERQIVVQLAYTLGEAHALHRLCNGAGDATWYARMQRLEGEEADDDVGRRQLVDSFNAGFAAREGQFATCSRRSRTAERMVAERGAALARRLVAPLDAQP